MGSRATCLMLVALVSGACSRSLPSDAGADLAVVRDLSVAADLEPADLQPPIIANCPQLPRTCQRDDTCLFGETCQYGYCCSGTLDPASCNCSCNGGRSCQRNLEACCFAKPNHNPPYFAPDMLICRDVFTCEGFR